jgi:Flp pilus assembly protein TadG
MRRCLRLSRGQMAVVMTIALPVLIGAMGLGADVGVLYLNWVRLQKAADAAALAGAEQLTGDPTTTSNSSITACAQLYACQDGMSVEPQGSCPNNAETCTGGTNDTMTVTPASDAKSVTVTISRTVPYFFFRVLGLTQGGVAVRATAGILPTTGACQAAPFGLPCKADCNGMGCYGQDAAPGAGDRTCGGAYNYVPSNMNSGTQIELKSDWTIIGVPGNWDPLAIGGSGGSTYRSNIGYGESEMIIPGQSLPTETGNIVGPTGQGFTDRGLSLTSTPVSVPSTLSPNDPHIVVVPLVDFTQDPKGGKGNVPVLDFVTLYVQALQGGNNTIVATVIPPVAWCGAPTTTTTSIVGAPFKAILCPDSGCPTVPGSAWPTT